LSVVDWDYSFVVYGIPTFAVCGPLEKVVMPSAAFPH